MLQSDPRNAAASVLLWTEQVGASITSIDDADGLHVTPEPPAVLDIALKSDEVRLFIAAWLEDAAERWPDAWAKGSPMVRTWLASRSCARIAFTGAQHVRHDVNTAHRIRDGTASELADLLAVGDVMRENASPSIPQCRYDIAT